MSNKKQLLTDNIPRKKWNLLPVLDFYMFREFIIPLAVLIMGFILLFIIGDLFDDLVDFLKHKETPTLLIVKYFILKLPGNIRFVLPLSVLLACMYTMANMGKSLEITAMRSSGISVPRACGAIYVTAMLITAVNFWFNEKVVPYSEREAFILLKSVRTNLPTEKVREIYLSMLMYRSHDGLRTWLFESFNEKGLQKDIILKKFRSAESHKLEWDLHAREAEFIPDEGWKFIDVTLTTYTKDGFMPERPQKFKVLKKDLDEIPDIPRQIMNSSKPPEDLPSWDILNLLRKTKNMPEHLESVYYTIFFHRLAFPWACILSVFIGIPLAAKNERGGILTSIVIAVVIIVLYQVTSHAFVIFGKLGWINPFIAGAGPTIGFILYGWINVIKQT